MRLDPDQLDVLADLVADRLADRLAEARAPARPSDGGGLVDAVTLGRVRRGWGAGSIAHRGGDRYRLRWYAGGGARRTMTIRAASMREAERELEEIVAEARRADKGACRARVLRSAPASRPRAERVYFIADDELAAVKIGKAQDVPDRMRTLQCANPRPLRLLGSEPGGRVRELDLHARFAHLRIRTDGEWFVAADELVGYAEALPECEPAAGESPQLRMFGEAS